MNTGPLDPSTSSTQIKTWTPGTPFKFTIGSDVINLYVEEVQDHMLTGVIIGGPRDGQKMTWSLGLPLVQGVSQ